MTRKAQQVLRDALSLPPRARADIAGTLLHSLDVVDEPDVEEAWATEIQRRIGEVQSGTATLVSWTQVRRRLRSAVRRDRAKG